MIGKDKEPTIRVGLIEDSDVVKFSIEKPTFLVPEKGMKIKLTPKGKETWRIFSNGGLVCENVATGEKHDYPEATFVRVEPEDLHNTLTVLHDITIGIQFHWQRDEDDDYPYILEFRRTADQQIMVINELPVERYLESVISSEMSGNCPPALLHAHTVIARSWLIAQMQNPPHVNYLVCHDDHCQRYQGMRRWTKSAGKAVKETHGEVLTYQGGICDTRYSKSCGGISENFENCWPPQKVPYCQTIVDAPESEISPVPDLTLEENVRAWVTSRPASFCNANPQELDRLLVEYDQEIKDLFRWEVVYSQEEITKLIESKTQKKLGKLKEIKTGKRGPSGRLLSVDFMGTTGNIHVDIELEIRRVLSPSHLYSACFVVDTEGEKDGVPEKFILRGGGWGHGVGLCQIGAAVMSTRGYDYKQILQHYYRGTELTQWW
jgi:stage II sporulation protein D